MRRVAVIGGGIAGLPTAGPPDPAGAGPVAHLVPAHVVGPRTVTVKELLDPPHGALRGEPLVLDASLSVEGLDLVIGGEESEHLRCVVGDPGRGRGQRGKEGKAHGGPHLRANRAYSSGP